MLLVNGIDRVSLGVLLDRYGLDIAFVAPGEPIPGSFWGDSEAGLVGSRLYLRPDTPLHSALHEAAHYVCMTPERRTGLHTDAGGDTDEDNADALRRMETLWGATYGGRALGAVGADGEAVGLVAQALEVVEHRALGLERERGLAG